MIKIIKNFIQGVAFGITGTVPAVSGGTIAIILGFYNETIEAVNHFKKDRRKYIKFLLPLLLGIIFGLILFSSIIHYLLTNYSFPTMTFFTGLIVGTIPSIYIKVKVQGRKFKLKEIIIILIPILVLLLLSNLRPVSILNPTEVISNIDIPYMFFILFAGIITGVALVVPGLSGSHMQLLLGIYPLVAYSVSSIRFLFSDIASVSLLLDITKVLAPLLSGLIIGGLLMARLIEKFLKKYYKTTYLIILGLLLGSVYALFKEPIVYQSGISAVIIITGIITFILGCLISFYFSRKNLKEIKIGDTALGDRI